MPKSLYVINEELLDLMAEREKHIELQESSEGAIPDFDMQAFDALQMQFNDKAENICKYIRTLEGSVDVIDTEIKRLQAMKTTSSNKATRLKNYLKNMMQMQGIEKVETDIFKLSLRKSSSLEIVDETQVPKEFVSTQEIVKIDKMAIKEYLKGNVDVTRARIQENQNLQIK